MSRRTLTGLAIGGIAVSLGVAAVRSMDRHDAGAHFALLLVVVVLCLAMMSFARERLRRSPGLLVPLGVAMLAYTVLDEAILLGAGGSVVIFDAHIAGLAFAVTAHLLIGIVVAVVYACWATLLVVQVVKEGNDDPLGALRAVPRRFWVVFGAMALGWAAILAALVLVPLSGELALLLVPAWTVWWNLTSAPLLIVAVEARDGFWHTVKEGLAASRGRRGLWAAPVILQLLLLGLVTYLHVEVTTRDAYTGQFQRTGTQMWNVNGIWTGGYADECKWYTQLTKLKRVDPVPIVSKVLALGLGVLAVVIKVHVAQALHRSQREEERAETTDHAEPA